MKPILPFLLACLLHSCSPDSALTETETRPARPICLSATIDGAPTTAATRVVGTGVIEDGTGANAKAELTGIHFLRKDATDTPTGFSDAALISASRDKNGDITFTPSQNYNLNGNNTYFVAYWPTATTTETGKLTWTISGNVDILKTNIYNAGSYTAPNNNTGMIFQHALAQLKVVLKVAENTSLEVAKAVWGQITKIELATSGTMTYTYATNELTNSAITTDLQLYNPNYSAFTSYTLVENNADVIAIGMFPPSTGKIKLKVTGDTGVTGEVEVQLKDINGTEACFESGKTHTVTLSLGVNPEKITVSATTIEPWGTGGTSNATPDGEYYAVGDYFQKDNNILGIVCQLDQTIDYVLDTDKGKKGLILYPAEPPLTPDATGTQATAMSHSEAIAWCTARNAEGNTGWRLPTAKELTNILSVYNAATEKWNALFSAANGTAIDTADNAYWSAGDADVTGATRKVRCVRRFDAAR